MEMEKYNLKEPEFLDQRGSFIVKFYKEEKLEQKDSLSEEQNGLIMFCKHQEQEKKYVNICS